MGLKDSSFVYQRLVSQTLADCPGSIAYTNDILSFKSTRAEQCANFRMVLLRLSDKDFRLQDGSQTEDQCLLREKSHRPFHCFAMTSSRLSLRSSPKYCPHEAKTWSVLLVARPRKEIEDFVKHCVGYQLRDKNRVPATRNSHRPSYCSSVTPSRQSP
ncbi:hypothetical protein PoB_007594200 [Plakobranchus ocellatus]|uniref:Uncharacterized protein n=1 Tax=Plakobranchus ocellatus TaxID=259542 RepID=A0AAV4DYN8_9GAST|nr:hypothetical protein PoB_007594200 [Plakobranchus ocellatus]